MTTNPPKPPLPRFVLWGYPGLTVSLRWDPAAPGRAETRLALPGPGEGLVWGEPHPGGGAAIDAAAALRWLASNWGRLAKPFVEPREAREAIPDGTLDLAEGFGVEGESVLWTVRDGRIEARAGDCAHAFGRETVLAVEILSGFASALAEGLRERPCDGAAEAVAAWEAAFAATDVLPWETEDLGSDEIPTDAEWLEEEMRKARFYCRRLGVDLDRYVRSTVWLVAEQGRFALGRRPEGEPDWHGLGFDAPGFEGLPTLAELEAPTPPEVRDLYSGLGAAEGASWEGFVAAALHQRTGDLRAALWFPHLGDEG